MDSPHQTWHKVRCHMFLSGATIGLSKDCNGGKNDFWLTPLPFDMHVHSGLQTAAESEGWSYKMGRNIPPCGGDVKSHFILFFIARRSAVEGWMVKSCGRRRLSLQHTNFTAVIMQEHTRRSWQSSVQSHKPKRRDAGLLPAIKHEHTPSKTTSIFCRIVPGGRGNKHSIGPRSGRKFKLCD